MLARESSFAKFLWGAKHVYESNYADDAFRNFFKAQARDALADLKKAWDGSNTGWGYPSVSLQLKDALSVPGFGSDIYEVLFQREQDRAIACTDAATARGFDPADYSDNPVNSNVSKPNDFTNSYETDCGDEEFSDNLDHARQPDDFWDGKTVFVAGLPLSATAEEVRDSFAADYGIVTATSLLRTTFTDAQGVQAAHVTFASTLDARKVCCYKTLVYEDEFGICVSYASTTDFLDFYGTMPEVNSSWKLRAGIEPSPENLNVTAIAVKDSDSRDCTISFCIGDRLRGVVSLLIKFDSN